MLISAVSSPELAAEDRVVNTMIGAVVGIAFSLLVPVSIPNARAIEAVRRVARSQAALLDEVALTLSNQALHVEEVQAWLAWCDDIGGDIDNASAAVEALGESRRLNPRALTAAKVHPGLRLAIERLDRCLAAERALLEVIGREAQSAPGDSQGPFGSELRRAFAVVLNDLADAVRAFGDLVSAEYGRGNADEVDEVLRRNLDIVRETRSVLTELLLLEVDPLQHADLWMVRASVLAAVDQLLVQLDLERSGVTIEPWLSRRLPSRPSAHPLNISNVLTLWGRTRRSDTDKQNASPVS